jgi:putative membrane protein
VANEPESTHASSVEDRAGTLRAWVTVYLKGLAMGIADSVPGISGGTIALITGIYERLIRAITRLDPRVLRLVPGVYRREVRTAFFERLRGMDALFLIVLGSGMVTAIVTVARGAEIAFETFPGPTFAFFFGLIGASAVALADRRWLATPGRIGAAVVGFLVAFLVSGAVAEGLLPNSLPVVFLGGSVAISGMILPGISGAFILLLLGQYDYMIETLNGFVDAVLGRAEGAGNQLVQEGTVVVTFLAGAFVGLFTVAYVVRWALDSYREATFAFLVSLMIGALRYPAVEIAAATETVRIGTVMPIVAAGLIGAVAVLALDHYSADIDY